LDRGWNGYGSEPIPNDVIHKAKEIVRALNVIPDVSPTARQSIQIEKGMKNDNYIELEVFKDRIVLFKDIDGHEEEKEVSINDAVKEFNVLA